MQNFANAVLMFEVIERSLDQLARAADRMSDQMEKASDKTKQASYAAYTGSFAMMAAAGSMVIAGRAAESYSDQLVKVRNKTAEAAATNALLGGSINGLWAILTRPNGWIQFAVTAGVLLAGPFLAFGGLLAMSTGVMIAWAAGATAMLTLLGGLALGFGALGAAIIALGVAGMSAGGAPTAAQLTSGASGTASAQQRLFDAQQAVADLQARINLQGQDRVSPTTGRIIRGQPESLAQQQQMEDLTLRVARAQAAVNAAQSNYNGLLAAGQTPLAQFKQDFSDMAHRLESASVPLAQMALNFADSFFPLVGDRGSQVISWFGVRLPGALASIKQTIGDLLPGFEKFSGFLGGMFDKWSPDFSRRFEEAVKVILPVTQNFIGMLGDLTTWFEDRLPTFGPVVNATFGWMGHAIESVAGVWGHFADWSSEHFFPLIQKIKDVWASPGLTPGGTVGSEFMGTMARDLPVLGKELEKFVMASPTWLPAITTLAGDIADLITGITLFLDGAGQTVGAVLDRIKLQADNPDAWAGVNNAAISFATTIGNAFKNAPDWLVNFDPFGFNKVDAALRAGRPNLTGPDAKQNRDAPPDPAKFAPAAGQAGYEAAQRALKTLQQVGIGGTGLPPVTTPGTDVVPAIARAQIIAQEAAKKAQSDAAALLVRMDRIDAKMQAFINKPELNLAFNVQGLTPADQLTARIYRKAMQV